MSLVEVRVASLRGRELGDVGLLRLFYESERKE